MTAVADANFLGGENRSQIQQFLVDDIAHGIKVLIGSFIPLLGLGTDVVDGTLGKLPLVKNLNARQRTELVVDIADIGLHFLGVPPLHFDERCSSM